MSFTPAAVPARNARTTMKAFSPSKPVDIILAIMAYSSAQPLFDMAVVQRYHVLMVGTQLAGERTVVSTVTSQCWQLRLLKLKRSRGKKREETTRYE